MSNRLQMPPARRAAEARRGDGDIPIVDDAQADRGRGRDGARMTGAGKEAETSLQRALGQLARQLGRIAPGVAALVAATGAWRGLQALAVYWAPLQTPLQTVPLGWRAWGMIAGLAPPLLIVPERAAERRDACRPPLHRLSTIDETRRPP